MKWRAAVVFCGLILILQSGCAILVIGTAGVAGGYAVTNDGIQGVKDIKFEKMWNAGETTLKQQGFIEKEDKEHGIIIGDVQKSTVRFEVQQATPTSIVVLVRARRVWRMFPNMKLAKRVYSMIMSEAGASPS